MAAAVPPPRHLLFYSNNRRRVKHTSSGRVAEWPKTDRFSLYWYFSRFRDGQVN